MDTDAMLEHNEDQLANISYLVTARDLTNYYHPPFSLQKKIQRLLEIKPYTFSVNDYFPNDTGKYLHDFVLFHKFSNTYWPRRAPFEEALRSIRDMSWYKTALDLKPGIRR